jgi:hypothetical protein
LAKNTGGLRGTMAQIPTEQEDVEAYKIIVGGTDLDGSSIIDMFTMSDAAFGRIFHSFNPLQKLQLEGMRGRYERRQGNVILW